MIKKVKSFSKGGAIIERYLSVDKYTIQPDKLQIILANNHKIDPKLKKSIQLQGFDKITNRQKLNSFQNFNIKDAHKSNHGQMKKMIILPRSAHYPIRQEKDERLSELFKKASQQEKQQKEKEGRNQSIKQAQNRFREERNQMIQTTNDLQKFRKTFHSFDFSKQTQRPFERILQKKQAEEENAETLRRTLSSKNDFSSNQKIMMAKTHSIHSFSSYTKRNFLSEKKLIRAPAVSGIDSFKVNPQKFKGQWKIVNAPQFEKVAKKHLSRYDGDSDPWYTKLAYNAKDKDPNIKSMLNFDQQSSRKDNFVKSNYPMRIAI